MSRPTLDELKTVYKQAAEQPADPKAERWYIISDGLAAVLTRLADYFHSDSRRWDGHPSDVLRLIAAEADPPKPEPDTKALKAAALEARDESDATMRHIRAMNAAMDAVLAALDGTMTYHGQPLRWERGKR
jgi:hypothetical protein